MAEDPRNYLYKLYARFLKRYQPRMFVFENVTELNQPMAEQFGRI